MARDPRVTVFVFAAWPTPLDCDRCATEDTAAPLELSEARMIAARSEIIEPAMVRIPEGWFGMGCATGRDDEKPVHRVWLDTFELAAYQVTNADYARFLAATNATPPPNWNAANFIDPRMPVVAVS